jgi:phosphoglycolate phosphatase-like HAD superfamily hydrolase
MYKTILFDIDGVMLSEERYFDASALTVFELVHSAQYLGVSTADYELPEFSTHLLETDVQLIRKRVFANDAVFHFMKQRGINANWDMVYLQTAFQLIRILEAWVSHSTAEQVVERLGPRLKNGWDRAALRFIGESVRSNVPVKVDYGAFTTEFHGCKSKEDLFAALEVRLQALFSGVDVGEPPHVLPHDGGTCNSVLPPFETARALWKVGQETFQEWYLGDTHVNETHQPGKDGFLTDEVPLVPVESLSSLFQTCLDNGVTIGIATGRPDIETYVPLKAFGWNQFFSDARITTASDVLDAEHEAPDAGPLSKPHPYSYLRSYLGKGHPREVLQTPLPLSPDEGSRTLVVGDSVADFLAAKDMGCHFAAILTGLEGEKARQQFEALGAHYIFDNVLGVLSVLR